MWKTPFSLWKTPKTLPFLRQKPIYAIINSMNSPLLQTKLWQNFQHDLENNPKTPEYHSETTFFEENNDFTYLAIKKSTPAGPYLYLPYGPYTRTKNGPKKTLEALQKLAAYYLKFED